MVMNKGRFPHHSRLQNPGLLDPTNSHTVEPALQGDIMKPIDRLKSGMPLMIATPVVAGSATSSCRGPIRLAQPGYVYNRYSGTLLIGMEPGCPAANPKLEANQKVTGVTSLARKIKTIFLRFGKLNIVLADAIPSCIRRYWKIYLQNLVKHIL